MADEQLIKPRELPAATTVFENDAIMTDDGVTVGKATPVQIVNAGAPVPTEAEAIAGTDNSKRMTPLTVKQVLDSVTAPSVMRAAAWAESNTPPDPGIPGSKSAKSWAAESERLGREQADRAEAAAADAVNNAPWNVKDYAAFAALPSLAVGARYRAPDYAWDVLPAGTTGYDFIHASGALIKVVPGPRGYDVRAFGAVPGSGVNYSDLFNKINGIARAANEQVFIPGGPYDITSLVITTKWVGTIVNRFTTSVCTFRSDAGAGAYAVTCDNIRGALDTCVVLNTGAGNGVDCAMVSTNIALKEVYVSTSYPLVTGSGSIGVNFGTDDQPGRQAITATFDTVTSRGYDICYRMRYYSNANVYRNMYALNTNNSGPKSSHGFLINGRGGHYDTCHCESNFEYAVDEVGGAGGAEENVFTSLWVEGVPGQIKMRFNGSGSVVNTPYGFVGGAGGGSTVPVEIGPYVTFKKKRGPTITEGDFNGFGGNLVRNSRFSQGIGGLSWGSNVEWDGSSIFGEKALTLRSAGSTTSFTVDHLLNYIDLDAYPWLRGKVVTYSCLGVPESGVTMTVRGIVRTAAGSNQQFATSAPINTLSKNAAKISFRIPTAASDAKYLVFRIQCDGVTAGTPSIAGKITLPSVTLGNDLDEIRPRHLSDGDETLYGNMTFAGSAWNGPHIVLGSHHLWVDAGGLLRIKNGTPTSDTDGTVVGTQA